MKRIDFEFLAFAGFMGLWLWLCVDSFDKLSGLQPLLTKLFQ